MSMSGIMQIPMKYFTLEKVVKKRYKDISNRNKLFLNYISQHNTNSRIVKYFDTEEEAFSYEKELTDSYRALGQCQCCLIDGGYGGYSQVWTDEFKEYWSKNNPMKSETQRQRMKEHNPMRNPEVAMRNGAKHKRKVIINDIEYAGVKDAAQAFGVNVSTMSNWSKQGGNRRGDICRYADEEQKFFDTKWSFSKSIYIDDQIFNSITEGAKAFGLCSSSLGKKLRMSNGQEIIYHEHKCGYVNQQPSQ